MKLVEMVGKHRHAFIDRMESIALFESDRTSPLFVRVSWEIKKKSILF